MPEYARSSSARISPSAHYTGYVWYRHGLSEHAFVTGFGRLAHGFLAPVSWAARNGFGLDIEHILLQRHAQIDAQLTAAIEHDGVRQVVEIASGLSPRGRRFTARYPHVRYLEADLPDMAARKRLLLYGQGWLGARHQVKAVDILEERGRTSLAALFAGLDQREPVVVITEGLVNYFALPVIESFWARLAGVLAPFLRASYLTELYPNLRDHPRYRQLKWGVKLIGCLTRGDYPLHYDSDAAIIEGFQRCGFARVHVLDPSQTAECLDLARPRMPGLVRVIQASL